MTLLGIVYWTKIIGICLLDHDLRRGLRGRLLTLDHHCVITQSLKHLQSLKDTFREIN